MLEEVISLLSIFASMNTWLTHTLLFLLLNLMIGTIAFTSTFTSHNKQPNHHHINHHNHHNNHQQPPTLTTSPSVLQRLKSTINFNSFYSHPPPTTTYYQPEPEPEPKPETGPEPNEEEEEEEEEEGEGPTLEEVYSLIKQGNNNNIHYGRQNSDTKPSNGETPIKLSQKLKKSASDKSAFNHFDQNNYYNVGPNNHNVIMEDFVVDDDDDDDVDERESGVKVEREEEEGCVNAKADDFINRFKKQLQLQRKESIIRYKEMIYSRINDVN